MTNLVKINTPKAVATETRKALRKLPNLESALNNLSSLKGVGTTMATGKDLNQCPFPSSLNVTWIFGRSCWSRVMRVVSPEYRFDPSERVNVD